MVTGPLNKKNDEIDQPTYRNEKCFAWIFSVSFIQNFLVDAHASRYEQCNGEQQNADGPPEENGKR